VSSEDSNPVAGIRAGHGMKLVLLLAAFHWVSGCAPQNEYQAPPPPKVTVAAPVVQDVTEFLEETGTTEAVERVEIRARVKGFLQEVRFNPNDEVKENDVLFLIEQREFRAQVDLAKAELESRNVEKEKAQIEADRQEELFKKKATPETNLVAARAELAGSIAAISAAKARLDEAERQLEYTEVQSPIEGIVGKTNIKRGNLVTGTADEILTTVISYDNIYANFSISERDYLTYVEERATSGGRRAEDINLYLARANDEDFPFVGVFNFADLSVDQNTGTYSVRGVFPNPDLRIPPGIFVRIRVPIRTIEDALLIPERATGFDQAGRYLLVVDSENTVHRRDVTVGTKFGSYVVIETGLEAGDLVVIDGVQRSRPGAIVEPEKTDLDPSEVANAMPKTESDEVSSGDDN